MDEQIIMETTGHRSLAVRRYKRTSEEQKKAVSTPLQASVSSPPSPAAVTKVLKELNHVPAVSLQDMPPGSADATNPIDVQITGKNFCMSFKMQ